MQYLHYRDLAGIGLTEEQIKAIAAAVTVPQGLDDQGEPKEGPGTPANQFRSPFPNEQAARAAHNGALPPDLSLIVNAREGDADYIYARADRLRRPAARHADAGRDELQQVLPRPSDRMPPPLQDGRVTYADGTPATVEQMAHDVVTFLTWAANPEMVERKQIGWRWVLFFLIMTGLTYAREAQGLVGCALIPRDLHRR